MEEQNNKLPERMTVEQCVAEVARQCGLPYVCETLARVNVMLKNFEKTSDGVVDRSGHITKMPFLLNVQNITGSFVFSNTGYVRDQANLFLAFCDRMPLDFTGKEASDISENLKSIAVRFVAKMVESGLFDVLPETVQYTVTFDRLDACLCMCSVSLAARESKGLCY